MAPCSLRSSLVLPLWLLLLLGFAVNRHGVSAAKVALSRATTTVCMTHTKAVFPMSAGIFYWQAFMLRFFPAALKYQLDDVPKSCVQRSEIYMDNGICVGNLSDDLHHGVERASTLFDDCASPFQVHIVHAPKRESGNLTMRQLEERLTLALGNFTEHTAFLDYNVAFVTQDLDAFIELYDREKVKYYPSRFASTHSGLAYFYSIIVPTPSGTGRYSFATIELIGEYSPILRARNLSLSPSSRAPTSMIRHGLKKLTGVARPLAENGLPVVTFIQFGYASSDLLRDVHYFENVLLGSSTYLRAEIENTTGLYFGSLGANVAYRYAEWADPPAGLTLRQWETDLATVHAKCFDSVNNDGFDALADFHTHCGAATGQVLLQQMLLQASAGLPYRFYQPAGVKSDSPGDDVWFYMYGPNGQGTEVSGHLGGLVNLTRTKRRYNFCTQGIKGGCHTDFPGHGSWKTGLSDELDALLRQEMQFTIETIRASLPVRTTRIAVRADGHFMAEREGSDMMTYGDELD
eukprot:NODE_2222_length_2264_cov_6.760880.p1 GENE.NODE_2222_length_2264_cov_6.760880~~NODE_2222_length_2264_cov_6.760880.p1  ORF type:complete len:519 (+),score=101.58 NODE_2222_length_2264_cov_6.760880:189-1745(+)